MALAKDGRLLIRGATLLTMVPGESPRPGDLRIAAGRIAEIGTLAPLPGEEQLDARGLTLLPGFVQAHVHLCQTLFRGSAEGLELLPWLRERIWPFEHAHDDASLRASARLSLVELASSGVTSFLSMESVRGTASVFEELRDSGLRGVLGNSLIDLSGAAYPEGFGSTREEALREALALASRYDRTEERVHFALSPRFLLSCSPELLAEVAELSREKELRIHTHAAEHPDECKEVEQTFGKSYIAALDAFGLLGARTTLAHCVHLSDAEIETLASSGTGVAHCPSTNLKLGSGIAPLSRLVSSGIPVGLGSDGAPANNRLDLLSELRLAGLLAQWKSGPGSVDAETLVALATREGARAIGLASECGTLEVGKAADLVLFDLEDPRCNPGGDPYTRLVYGTRSDQLRHVFANGVALVADGQLRMPWSLADLREEGRTALRELRKRVSS